MSDDESSHALYKEATEWRLLAQTTKAKLDIAQGRIYDLSSRLVELNYDTIPELQRSLQTSKERVAKLEAAVASVVERERVKELENALREIVFFAKPNRLSTKNKLVKEGICISGSLQHYEVMPHLIHIGKGLLQEQTK